MSQHRFDIESLGPPTRSSPLNLPVESFVDDRERILHVPYVDPAQQRFARGEEAPSFEVAGPRQRIFFDPVQARAAIVTCGGLSPGINDVIRALVLHLWNRYGVRSILGLRHGYHGLGPEAEEPLALTPELVSNIHDDGGTILGTSRGTPATPQLVDSLERLGVDLLFAIGGDGTLRGAADLWEEVSRRKLAIAVVGLPKTIDNDIPFVRRSFGFDTAVTVATGAVRAAHTEATSVRGGIGLVKLMGRHAGYIAANATLAAGRANFCLVPEVEFALEGENGLLSLLEQQLERRGFAVVVAAEGAGQGHFADPEPGTDASGNPVLGDVGLWLKEQIGRHFASRGQSVVLKYIDPSYLIRSAPANPSDSLFCARLGQNAVHAGMAGKTGLLIGYWHGRMTHVPLDALEDEVKSINPSGELWLNVLESTGQPSRIA